VVFPLWSPRLGSTSRGITSITSTTLNTTVGDTARNTTRDTTSGSC
jgi:hypothetical protein